MNTQQKLQAAAQRVKANNFKADEEHDIEEVGKQIMLALDPSLKYDTVKKSNTLHIIWEWDDTELGEDEKAVDTTLAGVGFRKTPGSSDLRKYESNGWGLVIGVDIATLVIIRL